MAIRLNKVTRDLNVGISTVVEFLQKKGFTIEASPNAKITDEQYAVLVKEFSTDKNLKKETEKFIQERQNKDRNKPTVSIEKEEPKKEEEIDLRPKFKTVGKIDLDSLNKRPSAPKAEEKVEEPAKVEAPKAVAQPEPKKAEPVKEEIKPEPKKEVASTEEVKVSQEEPMKKETPETVVASQEDEVFKIRPTEFKSGINVLGKIDLDALNQSTRPKKKSKEEKKKERDEKEKLRQQQRQQMKDAIIKEIRKTDDKSKEGDDEAGKKKKRNRIGKERVDINAPSNQNGGPRKEGKDNNHQGKGNNNKPGKDQGKPNKDRFKKPAPKVEVSDEDVAKQVKETLARLTNKPKNKAAKYRKEKRDNVRDRMMEQEEMEQEESKILKLTEFVTANELANMMDIPVTKVIGTCMSLGIMVSINQRLDAETINFVAEEFGYQTEYVSAEVS